jgi:phosphoglycerate kinase
VSRTVDGEVLALGNLSCMRSEEAYAPEFAQLLADVCDIYCNDAFALAHVMRASTVGVAHRARRSVAGLAFERELGLLSRTLDDPIRPLLTILGGELSEDKLAMVKIIAQQSQVLLLGGELCLPFLIARGGKAGRVEVGEHMVKFAEGILSAATEDNREIDLPMDFTTVSPKELEQMRQDSRFARGSNISNTSADELRHDTVICDIGETTRHAWSGRFGFARTIYWHGPLGISELEPFDEGTRFIARELANRTWPGMHKSLLAGRSLTTLLRRMEDISERLQGISSADRAALHYFARLPLPAVDALHQSGAQAAERLRILIPLDGSKRDAIALRVGAEFGKRSAEILLMHLRPGFDEESYPDFAAARSEATLAELRTHAEHLFSQANAILASRGLTSSSEMVAQGNWADMILRHARRLDANLIVLTANVGGLIPGSQRVIEQAGCGVIVAR